MAFDLGRQGQDQSVDSPEGATNGRFRWHAAAHSGLSTYATIGWSSGLFADLSGAPGRIRTCDTRFRKPLLYPLSYEGDGPQGTCQR